MDTIYYRIYFDTHDDIAIVCMQYFDESDYENSRFLSAKKFGTEEEAIDYLLQQSKIKALPNNISQAIMRFVGKNFTNILD